MYFACKWVLNHSSGYWGRQWIENVRDSERGQGFWRSGIQTFLLKKKKKIELAIFLKIKIWGGMPRQIFFILEKDR